MPGTVITVTSGKGGVGKTTTVANVASALAMCGQRVVVVDADIGLRNLDLVMGLESRIIYDLVDVVEGRCSLQDALVRDPRQESLYLLPAAQTRDKSDVGVDQMVAICKSLAKVADYVLVDSPAGIEHGFNSAVAPADRVLIVTTSDVSALRDADKVIYLLERDWNKPPGLVVNRYNARLARDGELRDIDDILDILAVDLLGVVPDDHRIMLATDRGMPVVLDTKLRVSQAYRNIAQRIMGNNVPLMRFDSAGPLAWLMRLMGR
ncbi:septum site-determining protein MinD [Litorilinea aerophila]|uniref:Septum site-determining protein MinD n=1 Tax=Litorilinea aerophila TaxID=1204385 RepID=A0A540VAQ3_9CHLR|nr:septum site-determining protein MinD [Litorilinea aerophila]MCC9078309.1 septum site-determining protein MinD [Litorilinea aerophila]OUC06246.1 cell division inhibitor MinD [Litorilinea aerophila]GIV77146.1 MAG: site-determining protein [Litorilinea sp.]